MKIQDMNLKDMTKILKKYRMKIDYSTLDCAFLLNLFCM